MQNLDSISFSSITELLEQDYKSDHGRVILVSADETMLRSVSNGLH